MALVIADRVKETTITTGTGAVTLAGAATGYQAFSAAIGNGNTTYYCIADQGGANWEVGVGTYASAGNTLARTTVLSSSNAGAAVNFAAGTKDVFVTYPSNRSVTKNAAGNFDVWGGTVNIGYANSADVLYADTGTYLKSNGSIYFQVPNGTNVGTFDGAGRFTTPYMPAFRVAGAASNDGAGNLYNFNASHFNNGSYFNNSTGRFTAPVAGYYFFYYSLYTSASTTVFQIRKNGTQEVYADFSGGTINMHPYAGGIVKMNANDYANVWVQSGSQNGNANDYFGGFLIG